MNREQYLTFYDRLNQTLTKYTECVKIVRADGLILRFTAHDKDLRVQETDGQFHIYLSANSFRLTSLEDNAGLAVSNMDIEAVVNDDSISEYDLAAGLYDNANVQLYIAYWTQNAIGLLPLRTSWIGEITTQGPYFKGDLRGIAQKLAQTFISTTSLECRWTFCDAKCALSKATYERTVTVTSVASSDEFHANILSDDRNKFQWGLCTWLTGNNAGASMEIIRNHNTRLHLFLPMSREISIGDTATLVYGCDKVFATCEDDFANQERFGGEPYLAGSDLLVSYPQSIGVEEDDSTGLPSYTDYVENIDEGT